MLKRRQLPVALTIAGSDSGGGAGIQADLKTFAAVGVHGTSVVTAITAQSPKRVVGIQATEPAMVNCQLASAFNEFRPQAIKTGMLFSAEIIHEVVVFLTLAGKIPPLIVDPVMVSTSGTRLLDEQAVEVLKNELLPLAALVTPNISEAEALTGFHITEPENMRTVARLIRQNFGCAVLIKGGHLLDTKQAIDIFYDGKSELLLTSPRVKGLSFHGTGCTYSAAIAGYCALGQALPEAVVSAKEFITQTIAQSRRAGGHSVLNCFWK